MKNFFPPELIALIPTHILDVQRQVKELTGIDMQVKEPDQELERYAGYMASAIALMDIDVMSNTITLWARKNKVKAHGITHELIHLRRSVIESAPKVFPNDESSGQERNFLNGVENELEHLFIVPEEIDNFPEARDWWNKHCEEGIERIQDDGLALVLRHMFVSTVLPENIDLIERCRTFLRNCRGYNILGHAERLTEDVQNAMPDKAAMIRAALKDLAPKVRQRMEVGQYAIHRGRLVLMRRGDF